MVRGLGSHILSMGHRPNPANLLKDAARPREALATYEGAGAQVK